MLRFAGAFSLLALLLVADSATGARAVSPAASSVVKMQVLGVRLIQGSNVVVLQSEDQKTLLPIWIGPLEAQAIEMRLHQQKAPRPLTHDLMESALTSLGARVERVEVEDLRDGVFYGRLTL